MAATRRHQIDQSSTRDVTNLLQYGQLHDSIFTTFKYLDVELIAASDSNVCGILYFEVFLSSVAFFA